MTCTCILYQPAMRFFCIYLCPFFLQCRKWCQVAFRTGLPHTEISPAPSPLTESTFAFIYYFNITFFLLCFTTLSNFPLAAITRARSASRRRNPRHASPARSPLVTRGQALGSHSHLFPSFFWRRAGKTPVFPPHNSTLWLQGWFSLSISLWTNRSHLKWMSGREKGGEQIPYSPLVREILRLPALQAQFPVLKAVPFTSQLASPAQAAGCLWRGRAHTPFLCTTRNSFLQRKWEQTHRVPPNSFHLNALVFFHLQNHFIRAFQPVPFCGL